MNIEEIIRRNITPEQFDACWSKNRRPTYQTFIEALIDRFPKNLPEACVNLDLKINSKVEGRINVRGECNLSNIEWEIFGEMVWLPKKNIFRGRLDINEAEFEEMDGEVEALLDKWDELCKKPESPEFLKCLNDLEKLANNRVVEAIEAVAESYSSFDCIKDSEKAYYWYYIQYALDDYLTEFDNQEPDPDDPSHYCGKVGDFRNESMVSDLVEELGFDKVRQLDKKAENFLNTNNR